MFILPEVLFHKAMDKEPVGIVVHAVGKTGVLHQLTGVIAQHDGDITSVEILDNWPNPARTYFEVVLPDDPESLVADLRRLTIVRQVEIVKTLEKIYGKRIIIVGGGAQVGQVAIGAVSEADRHNIRGEHISVDTIPLVGEQKLADAVRAVARLPRAKALEIWHTVNAKNLYENILPTRQRARLILRKSANHSIVGVALRRI